MEYSIHGNDLLLGFIFPFAVRKTSIGHGELLSLSKGFSIKGVVGQDPAILLQNALDKVGSGVKVASMINNVSIVIVA